MFVLDDRTNTLENIIKDSNALSDQCDCDIRDLTKKISSLESSFDDTSEKLLAAENRLAELDKNLNSQEGDVSSLSRRVTLLEVAFSRKSAR